MTGFLIALALTILIVFVLVEYNRRNKEKQENNAIKEKEELIKNLTYSTPDVQEEGIFDFIVAGTYYLDASDKIRIREYSVGDVIYLKPEPWNKVDKKAITVWAKGKIGYIPAYILDNFYTPGGQIRRHKAFIINIEGRVGDLSVEVRVVFLDGKGAFYL